MKPLFLIVAMATFVVTTMARQPSPTTNIPIAGSSSQARKPTRQFWLSGRPAWPLPPKELQTFGEETEGSIKVAIYGAPGCIKQPGYYFLPRQARVSDAINVAQGLDAFAMRSRFSGMQRKATNDAWEVEWFLVERRDADLSIDLHDGDMVYIGSYPFVEFRGIPFGSPPPNLAMFGEPGTNTVKVAIFGDPSCIKRPGYYFLPKWPTVSNVIEAAQGLDRRGMWSRLSGIQRQKTNGTWEAARFENHLRTIKSIVLQDGDMIYMGACAFLESKRPRWPLPSGNLSVFGKEGTDTIKIAVYGHPQAVEKPGYYLLRKGSCIYDALEAARGQGSRFRGNESGIQRRIDDETWETVLFSRDSRDVELSITLHDGDMIYSTIRPDF